MATSPLQGHPCRPGQGRLRLAPARGHDRQAGQRHRDRVYTGVDMNRKLVLERRDEVVAAKITEYLKATNRYDKTIVFCEDIEHAARMRQALSNANADPLRGAAQLRRPDHRRQRGGQARAGQLHRPGEDLPGDRHHVQADEHGRGCADLQADRAGPEHQVDDAVQSRSSAAAPLARRPGKELVHHPRLQTSHRVVRRSGLRRGPVQIYAPEPGRAPPPGHRPRRRPPTRRRTAPGLPGWWKPATKAATPSLAKYIVGSSVNVTVARERVQYLNAQGKLVTESLRDYTRINLGKNTNRSTSSCRHGTAPSARRP